MFSNTLKSIVSAAILLAGSAVITASAAAQEATFLYASYFTCPGGRAGIVDKIVEDQLAPIYDAAVEDGTIANWGWSVHHTGGKWQRIFSYGSDSADNLLKAGDILFERGKAANVDPGNQFGRICNAHDDYIWEIKSGNAGEEEGSAALSTYFQCDITKEDRADEIVKNSFAKVYDANVGKGKLTSWTWASHYLGGKYRRGMWTSAANYTDLLKTMDGIFETLYGGNNPDGLEFSTICNGHADYLWDRK